MNCKGGYTDPGTEEMFNNMEKLVERGNPLRSIGESCFGDHPSSVSRMVNQDWISFITEKGLDRNTGLRSKSDWGHSPPPAEALAEGSMGH